MRCPPPPIASQATACWTRRPYRWRRGGACSGKAQTRDAARTPRWRLEKPMGATPLRARGAPNSRRHGVHADASVPRCQLRRAEESAGELAAWRARGTARMRPGHNRGRLPDGQGEPPDNLHVAQRTEQPPPKRQAAGSSPAVGAISCDKRPIFVGSPQKTAPCLQKTPFLINLSHRTGGSCRRDSSPWGWRACTRRDPLSCHRCRGFAAREKPPRPPRPGSGFRPKEVKT